MEILHRQHFLLVAYPIQSHMNPTRNLAARLTSVTGARVTISTVVSGHRIMFPSAAPPDMEVSAGSVSYIPFSDGYDDDFKFKIGDDDYGNYKSQVRVNGSRTLSAILDRLAARGRPVTCVVCTLVIPWAAGVARRHGIPSAVYWIQPATSFACYYHYFHGYDQLIASHSEDPMFPVNLPGLPPLRIRELPSFLTITSKDDRFSSLVLDGLREGFYELDQEAKPRILFNTFDSLEGDALRVIKTKMEVFAIGPVMSKEILTGEDLFKQDEKDYMEWLDTKPASSVVYVSFGSLSSLKRRQMEELVLGLRESGRPYLWVLRKDNREEGVELEGGDDCMVVAWCNQVQVLSHRSIGCFVTHCGWNSTLESLACGVATVDVPQWAEQGLNARLMEEEGWGIGVRGVVDEEGVLQAAELRRCLEVVMGGGERGEEIRKKAKMWKEKAREAVQDGGSSERNLEAFVKEIIRSTKA